MTILEHATMSQMALYLLIVLGVLFGLASWLWSRFMDAMDRRYMRIPYRDLDNVSGQFNARGDFK